MSIINPNIEGLDLKDLKELLKEVKLYRDLNKQLWNRWKIVYEKIKTGKSDYHVEYFTVLEKDIVLEESIKVYKTVFWLDVSKEDIKLIEKDSLKWWIKVYLDDKVVDLSYDKIERKIKK